MSIEEEYSAREEYYQDWLSDNIRELRADFIEDNYEDEFDKYCRQAFEDYEPPERWEAYR
jgi:hypothetical protein